MPLAALPPWVYWILYIILLAMGVGNLVWYFKTRRELAVLQQKEDVEEDVRKLARTFCRRLLWRGIFVTAAATILLGYQLWIRFGG